MGNAEGIRKQTTIGKQVALGTPLVGAGGQILRRETSIFSLTKAIYESAEIVSHQQSTGGRHGVQAPNGKLTGLLSAGTYKLLWAASQRKDFVAGVNSTALVNVTAASTGGANGTYTRAAGSYLTDGFKTFDVIRWAGWTTTGAPNNARNFLITALTATVMTGFHLDGTAVGAKAAGDSVTATVVGKKSIVPITGHTDDFFTVEEWYPDIVQSELFTDCKVNQFAIDVPGSGNAKVTFDFIALKRALAGAQSFTSPAIETTTGIMASVTGALMLNGLIVANVTGLKFQAMQGLTPDGPVVGSNYSPDISRGRIRVTGDFTAYYPDGVTPALFQNETVTSLAVILAADGTATSDILGFSMGRIKLTGDTPDDGEKGIVRTYPFIAEINTAGGAALAGDQTILSIQDSQA
jgi:hypothetical protein